MRFACWRWGWQPFSCAGTCPRLPQPDQRIFRSEIQFQHAVRILRAGLAEDDRCLPLFGGEHMVAVFDFPERSRGEDDHLVPELVVHRIEGEGP